MSSLALRHRNRGAYSSPFSGVGVQFFPLGVLPDQSWLVLHEVGYLVANAHWNFPNVLSPFWRLYYNSAPGHKIVFAHGEFPLTPEHLVLIPDHKLFHCVGHRPVPHCWITFSVSQHLDLGQPIPILLQPTRVELDLLRQLASCFTGIGAGDSVSIMHTALALLHLVVIRPEIRWQPSMVPAGLMRAIRKMETDYPQPLHLNDLARVAGMCASRFARLFKSWRGVGPRHFLRQVRVRQAANLLVNTELSLDEIAEATGFPNRYYMSRVFKSIIGESPAKFRQTHTRPPQ
ncbi:MAG: helix-turn-helix transcriptional regulator [Verrucomicrobia bacterium]|nr:helix-turn-helix transcriptional regulator [Verrucomicrobiota bacterium]